MKNKAFALSALAVTLVSGSVASAANIFIAPARGADLSRQQQERITGMVRRSVENMPEHKLVLSEAEADFILRPAVVRRENGPVLRIEKSKEAELIAVAEQPLDMSSSGANAQAVTQTALQIDSYVGQRDIARSAPMKRDSASRNPAYYDDSVSGATSSAGPAGNLPPTADTMDTRSIHNAPTTGADMNTTTSLADSYITPDQMSGRDRQVMPSDDQGQMSNLQDSRRSQSQYDARYADPRLQSGSTTGASNDSGQYDVQSEQIIPPSANANQDVTPNTSQPLSPMNNSANNSAFNSTQESAPSSGGEVRAPSPKLASESSAGFFQMGFGPSFAIGLNSDNIMYNLNGAFNYNVNETVTAKAFGDFNIGTGADSAQFVNLGAGAEFYPQDLPTFNGSKPYLQADLGYGFARSGRNLRTNRVDTGDGVTIGGGAGFKFEASNLNWDIAAHYALLTSQVDERTPSVLGLRAALNF